jgi:pantoate--beta-alanine ligase
LPKLISVNVVGCPIHRENNNLAMSSRNELISSEERKYQTKFATNSIFSVFRDGYKNVPDNPHFTLEYFTIADEETLCPVHGKIK